MKIKINKMDVVFTQKQIEKMGEQFYLEQYSFFGKIKWKLWDKPRLKRKRKKIKFGEK